MKYQGLKVFIEGSTGVVRRVTGNSMVIHLEDDGSIVFATLRADGTWRVKGDFVEVELTTQRMVEFEVAVGEEPS